MKRLAIPALAASLALVGCGEADAPTTEAIDGTEPTVTEPTPSEPTMPGDESEVTGTTDSDGSMTNDDAAGSTDGADVPMESDPNADKTIHVE